jgi:hypothetical protein
VDPVLRIVGDAAKEEHPLFLSLQTSSRVWDKIYRSTKGAVMAKTREPFLPYLANRLSSWNERDDGHLEWELHHQITGKIVMAGVAPPGKFEYEEQGGPGCQCPNCRPQEREY